MRIGKDNLRWEMLTNPHAIPVGPMTQLDLIEAIHHLQIIDITCGEQRLTEEQMERCYRRFIDFCQTQWKNRN